jgi:hypothetical protein
MQENGNYFENKIKNQVSLVIFSNWKLYMKYIKRAEIENIGSDISKLTRKFP